MSNKWISIIEDEKHETYFEAIGIEHERAQELMNMCEKAMRKSGGTVSKEWDYALAECRNVEEVVFCTYKLGEAAGGAKLLQSLSINPMEGLLRAINGLQDRLSGMDEEDKPNEDDTEIEGSQYQ